MKSIINLMLAGALVLSLASCASQGPNQTGATIVGAGAGALVGGLIGGAAGGRGGAVAGVLAGGALGGLAGNAIGSDMDEKDRMAAMDAQSVAFESGDQRKWSGKRSYGIIKPGPAYSDSRGSCRDYTHDIYINGRLREARGVACRNPDGSWSVVS